jgi:hypothetical protein
MFQRMGGPFWDVMLCRPAAGALMTVMGAHFTGGGGGGMILKDGDDSTDATYWLS